MALITQYSRISHHTIFGLTGSTFSVPATEDFTSGSWTIYDLALSEIGVNETDEKAYIRIGNSIKEFNFGAGVTGSAGATGPVGATGPAGATGSSVTGTQSLSQTLQIGNYAATYSIRMGSGKIESENGISILALNDSEFHYSAGTISYTDPNLSYGSKVYTLNREVVTSSDSQTTLWSFNTNDLGSSEAVFSIDAVLNGIDPTGGQAYFAKIFAGFKCIGGTFSQVGITDITEIKDFTNATSDMLTDGSNIIFQVEGETATTIRWNARFNYHWTT